MGSLADYLDERTIALTKENARLRAEVEKLRRVRDAAAEVVGSNVVAWVTGGLALRAALDAAKEG